MLNFENKKLFLYEVDPLFFYDFDNDGFGDFKGFLKKISYFDFLNIDGIVFPDIFNQENTILKSINLSIFDKYGKLKDLKKIVDSLTKNNKELFVEINLENILNSMIIKKTIDDFQSNDIKKYIVEKNKINNNIFKWDSNEKRKAFEHIINFWKKINVNNVILTNFEFLYQKNNHLDHDLLDQLKILYSIAKEINKDIKIGLKSMFFSEKTVNLIFKKYIYKICDFYIDCSYSLISTNKKYPFDIIEKFDPKKLYKKIKKISIHPSLKSKYFISLNNNKIGKVNSRWLDENNLINESNKSLLLFSTLSPYSSINYYGDELGLLRLKINNKDDYQDFEYNENKTKFNFKKNKIQLFEYSQKYLSRINNQSIFIWNKETNGGFSKNDNIFRKLPINWKTHNLKTQYFDDNSIVSFYKKIIEFSEQQINFKIKIKKNIINKKLFILKWKSLGNSILIIINLSNETINKKISKKYKIIFSTFVNKNYEKGIKVLSPYESLVLVNN
ncbi:MAG: hypothetical protein IKG09_00365 [Mycoplasmataceae bacterium]|nr:hypothetical protein [Mycoplasmataceae bacterium]